MPEIHSNPTESSPLLPNDSLSYQPDHSDIQHMNFKSIMKETHTLGKLAWPVLTSYVVKYSINVASVFSLGHFGTKYLAASALTTMLCNVTGFSLGSGMNSALDTLCSQAFTGSPDPHALGKHLQRGFIVNSLMAIPIIGLWLYTEPILLLLGQDAEISRLSGIFAAWMIPGLLPYLFTDCCQRYLQCQGIMKPNLYIMLVASPVNMFLQWLLVWSKYSIGIIGAPIATSITNCLIFGLTILYIKFIEGYECWGGFAWKESMDWKQIYSFVKLGVPGILMTCSEWWAFEIVALAAGLLGDDILAAQTVVLNTGSLFFCVPLGLSIATATRIGNSLGANQPVASKTVAATSYILASTLATSNLIVLVIVKDVWGYLYTSDEHVVRLVANVLPIAALFQLTDGLCGMLVYFLKCIAVAGGILRGCGQQKLGGIINVVGYYAIGLPLGGLLTFKYNMGLNGLWIGLIVGETFVSLVALYYIIWKTDWNVQAQRALALVRSHSSEYLSIYNEED
ncbi:mate-domain-containing protein [Globomyces pollinis-pini]|nr:mate-domain-containing protein [Globomyces pollinis-pini]